MLRTKTNRTSEWLAVALALIICVLAQAKGLAQTKDSAEIQQAAMPEVGAEAASIEEFRQALNRLRPLLRFDTGEDFFPLKVNAITDNVGNRLARNNNNTIARRLPGGSGLGINYLRGGNEYPNGRAILNDDKIIERHESKADYFRDAARLQADSRYRDRIYGRVVIVRDGGQITGAWLQYWFYYYYNDFPYGPTGGDHEGDWELAQIKLDPNARPVYAVYSHHGQGSKCTWSKLRKVGPRPIVYVALGSHANYFRAGAHGQDRSNDGDNHRSMRGMLTIGNNTSWLNWPGFWGGTKAAGPFGATSPKGPKMQESMWDPEVFAGEAEADDDCHD